MRAGFTVDVFGEGSVIGVRYRDDFLVPYVCLFRVGPEFILMDYNQCPDRTQWFSGKWRYSLDRFASQIPTPKAHRVQSDTKILGSDENVKLV